MVQGLGRATIWNHARPNQIRARQNAARDGLASQLRGVLAALPSRKRAGAVSKIAAAETSERSGSGSNGENKRNAQAKTA